MSLSTKKMIESRLIEKFQPDYLSIIDDSDKHIGHENYQGGGHHFSVIISATTLSGLTRVAAHRNIYETLKDMIPDPIHALAIEVR